MATIEVTTQTPLRLTLDGTVDNGEVVSDLTPAAMATGLGVTATGTSLLTAANAAAARTTLGTNVEWLSALFEVPATLVSSIYIPVPPGISGAVTSVIGTTSGDPLADSTLTFSIGPSGGPFVPMTNGTIVVANGSTAGTIDTSSPSAANTVTGGTSVIEIACDNGAGSPYVERFFIGITRT